MMSLKQSAIASIGLIGLLSLGACSTTPNVLRGKFAPVTPRQVQTGRDQGDTVRWGGLIVDTLPGKSETCFRVMGMRLGKNGEPMAADQANFEGRFLACATDFYDPQLYARGRRVTFVGTVDGLKREKVGNYDYPYPKLKASVVHLWPRELIRPQTNVYYMNPWWGPYGGWNWWPWFGYPAWGAPPPYFRDPAPTHVHPHMPGKPPAPTPSPSFHHPELNHPAGRPLFRGSMPRDRQPIHVPPPASIHGKNRG